MTKPKSPVELKLLERIDDLLDEKQKLIAERDQLREVVTRLQVGDDSGLVPILPDQEARVVEFAETALVRGLTPTEAFFLGQMVQGFGCQRTLWALERKATSKQLVRGAYAMLNNNARGAPAKKKEVVIESVKYFEPPEGYSPYE